MIQFFFVKIKTIYTWTDKAGEMECCLKHNLLQASLVLFTYEHIVLKQMMKVISCVEYTHEGVPIYKGIQNTLHVFNWKGIKKSFLMIVHHKYMF